MGSTLHNVTLPGIALAGLALPVTLKPSVPVSDEELLLFSRRNRTFRIERNAKGELEIMAPVGGDGSHRESLVNYELFSWTEEHGGMCFSSNGGFSLPDGSVLSTDAAWVSEGRWNALSREQRRSFPPLCPEFVIEILSASDSLPVLQTKMQVWIANGAKLAWLIDPYAAAIHIYRPGKDVETLRRLDSVEADGPVAGVSFDHSAALGYDDLARFRVCREYPNPLVRVGFLAQRSDLALQPQ